MYEELGVRATVWDMIFMQEFVKEGSTTIDFWYEILNPQDFREIDIWSTSHGFELSEVGFFSPEEVWEKDVRPKNLLEILGL